jgi:hypothetical protein
MKLILNFRLLINFDRPIPLWRQSPAYPVYSIEKGSSKENVTVVCAFSASGQTWPPMIINRYQRSPEKIVRTVSLQ